MTEPGLSPDPDSGLDPAARPRVWPKALLVMGIDIALVAALIATVGWGVITPETASILSFTVLLIVVAELLGGCVLAFPEQTRPLGQALILGFFLFIGTGLLLLGGACLVLVSLS